MKNSKFPYIVFVLINIGVAVSCYFYPVMRDEFYYLGKINVPSPFVEFHSSYQDANPRIGQFFANLVSRNLLLEVIFGMLLFNAFISVLFLNIYRRLPDFRQFKEVRKFLFLAGFFILFINYFGEMFYYTPFSTNYTFTHVFYLLYAFVISEYYLYVNKIFLKRLPSLLLIGVGIFIGMCNEHVPPVLVGISFLCSLLYFIKFKKLPSYKLIVLPLSVIIGYAILFFAPANKIKQKTVGKSVLDINLLEYFENWIKIIKTYFYYNSMLFILILVVILGVVLWYEKIEKALVSKQQILFWSLLFFLPLVIVAVSPLIGTRLLFFSTSVLIIVLYKIILVLFEFNNVKINIGVVYGFLFAFFGMSVTMTFRANQNYEMLISEIEQKSKQSKDLELEHPLNYFTLDIGNYFNRKIFLESGEVYLDQDASHDTPVENNLKEHYQLQSIKEK